MKSIFSRAFSIFSGNVRRVLDRVGLPLETGLLDGVDKPAAGELLQFRQHCPVVDRVERACLWRFPRAARGRPKCPVQQRLARGCGPPADFHDGKGFSDTARTSKGPLSPPPGISSPSETSRVRKPS